MKFNVLTMSVVIVALVVLAGRGSQLAWTAPRIAGAAVAIPAFLLFITARLQLGRAFSVKAKATMLVTTGLYSRIRNPIYVFGSLLISGMMIWAGKPWWLLCFLALIPLQLYRSRKEEQVLTEKFGDAYVEYKRKTWF